MSKRNFLMALLTALGMHAGTNATFANTNTNSSVKKATEISINPKKSDKHLNTIKYPSSVSELNRLAGEALEKKQYKKCIDLCDRVLITGEKKQYAPACYMLGRAYMGLNNYTKAIVNFELALKYYNAYGIARPEKDVDYVVLYTDAINQAKEAYAVLNAYQKQGRVNQ